MPSCVCIQLQEMVGFVVKYLGLQSICSYAFHRKFLLTIWLNSLRWLSLRELQPSPLPVPDESGGVLIYKENSYHDFYEKVKSINVIIVMSLDVLHCSDVCLSVCLSPLVCSSVSCLLFLPFYQELFIHIAIYKKYNDKSMKRSRLIDWLII